jgi:hypothetical protein
MKVEVSIDGGTPESREFYGRVQRAIGLTERLNRIPYEDREAIRQAWIELTGAAVDEAFHLIKRESRPGQTNPTPRQVGHLSTGTGGSVFARRPQRPERATAEGEPSAVPLQRASSC